MKMKDMVWIYAALIFLLSEAWSEETGVRTKLFKLGIDANLTCNDKTWNVTLYIIWDIHLKSKSCKIMFNHDGTDGDSCNDGKSLRNTSTGQLFLHIPNFSTDDTGSYKCDSAYQGNSDTYEIKVAAIVPPSISVWLEQRDNKMVAVCKAERGRPAANISWSHTSNSTMVKTLPDSDGFFSVESHLLLDGVGLENLSCAISHPYWPEEQILLLKEGSAPWLLILIMVAIFPLLMGFSFFARKHKLCSRPCQQSNTSPPKSSPEEVVEEVEPYASYVQRENSIYNSTADLFT